MVSIIGIKNSQINDLICCGLSRKIVLRKLTGHFSEIEGALLLEIFQSASLSDSLAVLTLEYVHISFSAFSSLCCLLYKLNLPKSMIK